MLAIGYPRRGMDIHTVEQMSIGVRSGVRTTALYGATLPPLIMRLTWEVFKKKRIKIKHRSRFLQITLPPNKSTGS